MKKIAVMAAASLLAACASLASAQTPTATKVMVNEKGKIPLIWIDQEPIIVRGTNVTITWVIGTTGYEFPDNGIVFAGDAAKEFTPCQVSEKGQVFRCVDRNTKPGLYKYTINVRPSGKGTAPKALDPTVMND